MRARGERGRHDGQVGHAGGGGDRLEVEKATESGPYLRRWRLRAGADGGVRSSGAPCASWQVGSGGGAAWRRQWLRRRATELLLLWRLGKLGEAERGERGRSRAARPS
jgi:hypothetical protein